MLGGLPPWNLASFASRLRTSSAVTLKLLSDIFARLGDKVVAYCFVMSRLCGLLKNADIEEAHEQRSSKVLICGCARGTWHFVGASCVIELHHVRVWKTFPLANDVVQVPELSGADTTRIFPRSSSTFALRL